MPPGTTFVHILCYLKAAYGEHILQFRSHLISEAWIIILGLTRTQLVPGRHPFFGIPAAVTPINRLARTRQANARQAIVARRRARDRKACTALRSPQAGLTAWHSSTKALQDRPCLARSCRLDQPEHQQVRQHAGDDEDRKKQVGRHLTSQ